MPVLAMIAHDGKKDDIVRFAKEHLPMLGGFEIIATGTTGERIQQATGLPVRRMLSGPYGGDAQIARSGHDGTGRGHGAGIGDTDTTDKIGRAGDRQRHSVGDHDVARPTVAHAQLPDLVCAATQVQAAHTAQIQTVADKACVGALADRPGAGDALQIHAGQVHVDAAAAGGDHHGGNVGSAGQCVPVGRV